MKLLRLLAGLAAITAFAQRDPWTKSDLLQPEALAARLKAPSRDKPLVLFVGFPVLYRNSRIPGAIMAGPASKPDGLDAFRTALAPLSRSSQIVIYCCCCPFDHCPNVRPAFTELRKLGFTHVSVLSIPENMSKDWISKGYPTERR